MTSSSPVSVGLLNLEKVPQTTAEPELLRFEDFQCGGFDVELSYVNRKISKNSTVF